MVVGVDFDNTIVCYDEIFHRVALEQQVIPPDLPASKGQVRDYLRQCGQEDVWTELQGYVYGARMQDVAPFSGVLDFFCCIGQRQVPLYIISHKTRHPYMGPQYDLHGSARSWLELNGFYDPDKIGLQSDRIYFELTKQDKLARIGKAQCSYFIDDLPEFLAEAEFPVGVNRILFDPQDRYDGESDVIRATSWADIQQIILDDLE